ncbi:MAG: TRL-like family protein [Planctomycetota bacterium]|nr:TRL-like family protein [Planctomycetota bacterium]
MKKLAMVAVLALCGGCGVAVGGPVAASLVFTKGPGQVVDNNVKATKVGKASATGVVLVAFGDSSVNAAARDGAITKVHHVDYEYLNILGMYAKSTTVVYGE